MYQALKALGAPVSVRMPRGREASGACGQLMLAAGAPPPAGLRPDHSMRPSPSAPIFPGTGHPCVHVTGMRLAARPSHPPVP